MSDSLKTAADDHLADIEYIFLNRSIETEGKWFFIWYYRNIYLRNKFTYVGIHLNAMQWSQRYVSTYSIVPNSRACTFINFEKKFRPAWPYFGLHFYWFWEKIPPARLFSPMWTALFWSACLLILRKSSPFMALF